MAALEPLYLFNFTSNLKSLVGNATYDASKNIADLFTAEDNKIVDQ